MALKNHLTRIPPKQRTDTLYEEFFGKRIRMGTYNTRLYFTRV